MHECLDKASDYFAIDAAITVPEMRSNHASSTYDYSIFRRWRQNLQESLFLRSGSVVTASFLVD